ncbi:hypothetical protein BU23DRAFT_595196, partial [Bimuria novae-zelandiae CBS 107.79]
FSPTNGSTPREAQAPAPLSRAPVQQVSKVSRRCDTRPWQCPSCSVPASASRSQRQNLPAPPLRCPNRRNPLLRGPRRRAQRRRTHRLPLPSFLPNLTQNLRRTRTSRQSRHRTGRQCTAAGSRLPHHAGTHPQHVPLQVRLPRAPSPCFSL